MSRLDIEDMAPKDRIFSIEMLEKKIKGEIKQEPWHLPVRDVIKDIIYFMLSYDYIQEAGVDENNQTLYRISDRLK